MDDLQAVFRVGSTPTLGVPVFQVDYRASARLPPWWTRWAWAWRRLILSWLRRLKEH